MLLFLLCWFLCERRQQMKSMLPNSVITLLVQIRLHIRNSRQLVHLDDLGAHRTSFTGLHNPVATPEMLTETNIIKTNMYVRRMFHPLSCVGHAHKHTSVKEKHLHEIYINLREIILMEKEEHNTTYNRTEHRKGRHISDPRTSTTLDPLCSPYIHVYSSPAHRAKCGITSTTLDPLCSPYIHAYSSPAHRAKCGILPTEMSSESPGFLK